MLEHIRTKKSEYERSHLTMYENRDRSTGLVGNFFFSGMRKKLVSFANFDQSIWISETEQFIFRP